MSMKGKEFVEKLNENKKGTLLENDQFVIVGQNTEDGVEDTAIVMVKQTTKAIMCAFTYNTSGIIYNMSFGNISFVELCELTDTIKDILEKENL